MRKKRQWSEGSGLTQRNYADSPLVTREDFVTFLRTGAGSPSESFLNHLLNVCKEVLLRERLPDHLRPVVWYADKSWRDLPKDWQPGDFAGLKRGEVPAVSITDIRGATKEDRFIMSDSDAGYAARILHRITMLNAALLQEDGLGDALSDAYRIGRLAMEWEVKRDWEPSALTGLKVIAGGSRGGRQKSENTRERNIELALEYQRRRAIAHSTLSNSELKKRVGRDLADLGRSASISAIDRGLKFLSGKGARPDGD